LPLDLNNVTTSVDNEFNNLMSSVETAPTSTQDPFQQSSLIKPLFPPAIDDDDLVKSKNARLSKPSRANKIKNSRACSHCQKSKVKCNYLDSNSCKRCAERGLKCAFHPQQRRGPKPGKKTIIDTQNLEDFRKLSRDFTQKAHKLGFNVHTRIVAYPNNNYSGTPIPNHDTKLSEENLIAVYPGFAPPLPILSSINCKTCNSSISNLDDQRFFMNNEIEPDPKLIPLYPSFHRN
ncbi:16143_t:CDS:1, partial [Dentiscutata heterogama]